MVGKLVKARPIAGHPYGIVVSPESKIEGVVPPVNDWWWVMLPSGKMICQPSGTLEVISESR